MYFGSTFGFDGCTIIINFLGFGTTFSWRHGAKSLEGFLTLKT
jgi:hypothetical protein